MPSGTTARHVPTFEQAYSQLMPLFFGALGRLARQGFVVSPADGMDLIHDFFAEAWGGLVAHYDPNKGSFEGYAYVGFVQFSRPRIVRLQRWQLSLVDSDEFDAFATSGSEVISDLDEAKVRDAIAALPPNEQEILQRYLYSDSTSKRLVAREFQLTRYRLREILVDALGRVAVSLDQPPGVSLQDWDVACALWRDRRTFEETAAVLSLTAEQVRRANKRNSLFLQQVLRRYENRKVSHARSVKMTHQPQMAPPSSKHPMSAIELLQQALVSAEEDAKLLDQVRERAPDILEKMEAYSPDINIEKVPAERVAKVYQALFQGAAPDLQAVEPGAAQALFSVHAAEDTTIGEGFRNLVAGLPLSLSNAEVFSNLPRIPERQMSLLRKAPDVRAAQLESEVFLPYGIRPVKLFYATEAVSGLSERLIEMNLLGPCEIVLGDEREFRDDRQASQKLSDLMIQEIAQVAETDLGPAGSMYHWLIRVAQYRPYTFKGFQARPRPNPQTVSLTPSSTTFTSIVARWGFQSLRTYVAS